MEGSDAGPRGMDVREGSGLDPRQHLGDRLVRIRRILSRSEARPAPSSLRMGDGLLHPPVIGMRGRRDVRETFGESREASPGGPPSDGR